MECLRCPKCLLIPRIIEVNYEFKKFNIRYFCPNNHTEIIYYKNMKKYDLNKIKCNECNNTNNKSLYYCRECFNILCKNCKKIHQEKQIHKNIIDLNIIDDICYIHNEINIVYCKNCEESICNKCAKSEKHKEHEKNEIKLLDLINLKNKCIKFKKKLAKNLEEYKLRLFKQRKNNHLNDFKNNNEIKLYIKELKNINLDIADFILDMINDFDIYKKTKKFPNYVLYLNSKFISKFISDGYYFFNEWREKWISKNYQIYKSFLLKDEMEDNKFFFDKNLVSKKIIKIRNIYKPLESTIEYCYFYMNEKGEGIIIYLDNNILCYRNIETLEDFKKIEINNINIKFHSAKYLICCKKEYLLLYNYYGSFEVFMLDNEKFNKINSNIKKEDIDQEKLGFNSLFLSSSINYFNKNIYVSCFYQHKIYIYNILLNQVEIVMDFNDTIIYTYNKYFLNNKNIYDFLFVATEKQCYIYDIKKFSLKKKLLLQNVYYVLLSEISNKDCLIISYDENLIIIDFFSNDILYKTSAGKTQCLFLWNQNTIIENSQIDSCADNSIYDLFDGEHERVFNELNDFWWTDEIYKIELKKYGKCLLRIGEEKINLYYIKTEEEIKKEKEKFEQ